MKITFALAWARPGKVLQGTFKLPGTQELFSEYSKRIARFGSCEVVAAPQTKRSASGRLWVCERAQAGAAVLSSEELALRMKKLKDGGVSSLEILVGGPNGYRPGELGALGADMLWSFGPLTLPHELAAVVASEQIYRALSILSGHPYHHAH
jgi:23S rRNA pseudoU1915 N3-methylase RlmH